MSIEEALLEIEAQQFVGRKDELSLVEGLLARPAEAVAYVYGPPGVGKTALLRAAQRAAERRGQHTLAVAAVRQEGAEGVMRQVAEALGLDAAHVLPANVLTAVSPLASSQGLLLIVDDYDAIGPTEAALRTSLLYRLPPGTTALLAGRLAPAALWPLERAWRSFVERIALSDLPLPDARRLLMIHGIEDALLQREACQLTAGRPALLAQVADVLAAEREVAASTDVALPGETQVVGAQALILERILHPGSRRSAWRAESAAGAQELVLQAASLLPYFRRDLLASMVGEEAAGRGWEIVERLPCSLEPGNWYRLHEDLRRRVATLVARERPWLRQIWLRRAVRSLLAGDGVRGQAEDALTLRLLFDLGEPPDMAAVARGAEVLVGDAAAAAARHLVHTQWLDSLAAALPQSLRVVQSPEGTALAAAVAAPLEAMPAGVVPPGIDRPGTLVFALAARERSAVPPLLGLLAAAARAAPAVAAVGLDAAQGIWERLGLRPVGQDFWLLEPHADAAHDWLQLLAARRLRPPDVADAAGLAKEALQALAAGRDLRTTQAAAVYAAQGGRAEAAELRRWLLDALRSAEIGDAQGSRRALLRLYYVEKAGSHEDIAERLDLPRASYFRAFREALTAFGSALCGAG